MRLLSILLILLLAGCASTGPDERYAAQPKPQSLSSLSMIIDEGAELTWGGIIQGVENLAEATRLEVLSFPLNRDRRPLTELQSTGRFIVEMPGFVEPYAYPPGREVTVIGRYQGLEQGHVGDARYRFPVLTGSRVDAWAPRAQARSSRESPDVRWNLGIGTHGSGVGVGIGL